MLGVTLIVLLAREEDRSEASQALRKGPYAARMPGKLEMRGEGLKYR
jgi:hypothetical protein